MVRKKYRLTSRMPVRKANIARRYLRQKQTREDIGRAYHEGAKGYAQGFKEWEREHPDILDYSTNRGISAIKEHHPVFRKIKDYLSRHVNKGKLREFAERIYSKLQGRELSDDEREEYLKKVLSDYVASGRVLDSKGRHAILRKSLEEKAQSGNFLSRFLAGRELRGEKYIDDLIDAFRTIDDLFESEGHYRSMPKLKRSVKTIRYMGALREAMGVLDEKGVMNRKAYSVVREINRNIERGYEDFLGSSGHYSERYKAAVIFGIFGTILIAVSGTGITGNTIGNSSASAPPLIAGIIILVFALILLWRSFKN